MPHRTLAAAILLAVLELATATTTCAQSVADLDHAMRAMKLRMTALNTTRKNLQKLEAHGDAQERDAVRNITDADVAVFAAAVKVFTVAFIASGMKCPDDFSFTQKQFGSIVKTFVTTADEELALLDPNLRSVVAPAALAEATSIRDTVVDLRDLLKPFAAED